MQLVTISGPRVGWAKMGTWKVIDNEPDPPTHKDFGVDKGWEMVTNLLVAKGGDVFISVPVLISRMMQRIMH